MRQREWGEPCAGKLARMVRREVAGNTVRLCAGYPPYFVVMCPTQQAAVETKQAISDWLAVRGLQLSAEKTQICPMSIGFDFLGFNVRDYPSHKTQSGWKVLIKPSKTSVQKIRKRLRDEWKALNGHPVTAVMVRLNPIIRGWANYFRTQVARTTFERMDYFMYQRAVQYVDHMHPHKPRYWKNKKYFGKLNLYSEDKWVFGDKQTGFCLHKFTWTSIQRHALVTGTNSPDDPALQDYWHKRQLSKIKNLPAKPGKLAKRQEGKCPVCGDSLFIEEDIEKHHIVPRKAGGPDTLDNQILVHYLCHQQLTAQQRHMGYL